MYCEDGLGARSEWIAFLDETGDSTLESIDPDYPLFGLIAVVCKRDCYLSDICTHANAVKHVTFGHEGAVFHSYSIRKRKREFTLLHDDAVRKRFMTDLSSFVEAHEYTIFFAAIDKTDYLARYGAQAEDPYNQALEFILERLFFFCRDHGIHKLPLIAEMRGKNEDQDLQLHFFKILAQGTYYINAERFAQCGLNLEFASKKRNIVGLQLADLCAYPLARHVTSKYDGPDYKIVEKKLHRSGGHCYGMKVFP